ncbi:MAG: zinc-ribbon domain-containing protein [Lachnospiraceae bacterium]|nr:zinc-ribbon domain-containing protein [Lachnospiraceae bacterium]
MICKVCGKEILDDSVFCEFCGSKVDEEIIKKRKRDERKIQYQEKLESARETGKQIAESTKEKSKELAGITKEKSKVFAEVAKKTSKKLAGDAKEKSRAAGEKMKPKLDEFVNKLKANKKKVIVCGSILVACVAIVLIVSAFTVGNQEKIWSRFAKAFTNRSRDKVVSLMIPKSDTEAFEKYLSNNSIDLGPHLDEFFSGKDVESLKIAEKNHGDDKLKKYFDLLLEDMSIKMKYSDVSLVKMSDNTEMFMYKVDGRWYILPDGMDLMINLAAGKDAENGSHIASAIQTALSNQKVYDAMHVYGGVYFVLRDELPNLPQSFQDEIKELVGEIPEVYNTRFGGRDFALYLNASQNVINVFVASDNYLDEWVMYPKLDESYKTGDKGSGGEKVKTEDVQSELSYARLVDNNSSIAGYWQADGAGMYIGFDNFRGSDQFVIYSTFEDVVFPDAFDLNVGDKKIEGTGILNDESRIQFNIKDKDNIDVVYKSYNDEPELNFSFKKSNSGISEDVLNSFQGKWVGVYGGDTLELELDSNRGLIYDTKEDRSIFSGDFTCLYDGKDTLKYIFPYHGDISQAYEEYDVFTGYDAFIYTLNGDELEYFYLDRGSRMVEGRTWYREGSETANVSQAIAAYDEYIGNLESEIVCNLAYLDNDKIPECIYNSENGDFEIMTYKNGEIVSFYEELYFVESVQFIKSTSTGRIIQSPSGDVTGYSFFTFENGKGEILGDCSSYSYSDSEYGDDMSFVVNGDDVSRSEFLSFYDSFGNFDNGVWIPIQGAYTDVYEAYDALIGEE